MYINHICGTGGKCISLLSYGLLRPVQYHNGFIAVHLSGEVCVANSDNCIQSKFSIDYDMAGVTTPVSQAMAALKIWLLLNY